MSTHSTPLGGEPPEETPKPTPAPQQQHDPESPENLLQPGKTIKAADLQAPPSKELLDQVAAAELPPAEDPTPPPQQQWTAADTIQGMTPAEAAAARPDYPPQPQQGMPNRPPAVTELPQGDGSPYSQQALPATRKAMEIYEPPPVPITEEDITRMLECIVHNKHYSETFEKGPIRVQFRVKSAKEVDFQRATLSKMAADGEFGMMSDFQSAIARFNQMFQVVNYNGRQLTPVVIPPRPWKKEDINLEEQYWQSWLAELTESAGYIVHGMMIQFENKIYRMQQRMLEPDFTMPAAHSSSDKGSPAGS